jgi:ribosomal protein S18 acetylase RimI-like enzyme
MDPPIRVVRVEAADLETLMIMANSRLREDYSIELFQHFFETQGGCFFNAKDDDRSFGFILGVPMDSSSLRILMLVVEETNVRKGIGSMLLRAAEAYACSRKMTSLVLEVGTLNEVAIEFYKKHGFTITGVIPEYYNDKTDAFVMRKFLPM